MGPSRSSKLKWLLHWLPAVLAVVMIAIESTATMSAANTSRWLLPLWVHLFGPITAAHWAVVNHLLRKGGHFFGYGLVSAAFFYGWWSSLKVGRSAQALWQRAAVLAVLCTLLVACADEYHQRFLPDRSSSPIDVAIDVSGAVVTQILLLAAMPRLTRKSRFRAA